MKPEQLTKAPENAGIDPSTMRGSIWYQETTREDDVSHFASSSRVGDVFTGITRTSYQTREPVEGDEDRLAMKRGDMLPPVPKRVYNPRIREDQALLEFHSNWDRIHRSTSEDAYSQAWFEYSRITCQRNSAVFSSTIQVPSIGRVNSENHRA